MSVRRLCATLFVWATLGQPAVAQFSPVANGDFEQDGEGDGVPDGWLAAGAEEVRQSLSSAATPEQPGRCARLVCTSFKGGSPSSHAMLCQVGQVGVERGKWYRLTFRAKGEGIRGGVVQVGLTNTRTWQNVGLYDGVALTGVWRQFDLPFQATANLPAAQSRLQFWFGSTGTLWIDDVALVETDMRAEWQPQLITEGRANFLPNSSFECGGAGWGSYSPDLRHWHGNLFRLLAESDDSTAVHGRHSLKLSLAENDLPVYYFDWFDPVRDPVRCVVAAHHGWVPVEPGESYTLSVSLKAAVAGTGGVLLVRQAGGRTLRQDLSVGVEWQRHAFTFRPDREFFWVGAGLDLAKSPGDSATVWLDAIQLEHGDETTTYNPAAPVEVMAEAGAPLVVGDRARPGNASLRLHAYNDTVAARSEDVEVTARDFFDREVLNQIVSLNVPAKGDATRTVSLPEAFGFFGTEVTPKTSHHRQFIRAAVLPKQPETYPRFGMNHAYPWRFLIDEAELAGLRLWRDWSLQWRTVQPTRGGTFDFTEPDAQIERVTGDFHGVVGLLPFPSAAWTSTASPADVEKLARNDYEKRRIPLAFKPNDEAAFTEYVRQTVRHYRGKVGMFQVFNEALYTNYSLPAAAGHTMADYLRLLRLAHDAVKAENPKAWVIAGPGIWADNHWLHDFVEGGGLQYVDALDLHLYPKGDPASYADALGELRSRMEERNEVRPMWITELGCYADDDPALTPLRAYFGDSAMRKALHDTEREAAQWLVKFCTLCLTHGCNRVFLHAGTCGEINGLDVGGVFFEYAGAPRKMLPAAAVFAATLPDTMKFAKSEELAPGVTVHWFGDAAGLVGVAWATDGAEHPIQPTPLLRFTDLMGNPLTDREVLIGSTPVYVRRWSS